MDEISMLAHQGGIGVIFVYTLQLLKSSKWFPWINQNSAALNRWLGMGIALFTSLGFKLVGVEPVGNTGYHITIFAPTLPILVDAITHAAAQFAGQQILYHTAVKDTVGGMRTLEMEQGTVRGAVAQVAIGETKTDAKGGA